MTQRIKQERGDALITVALTLVVLLAFLALAVDVGLSYAERRRMQNAADAASLAGAQILAKGGTDGQIFAAVRQYGITENGADTLQADYVATVGGPAIGAVGGGAIPNNTTGIRVRARETHPTFIAGLLGINTMSVQASGAGGLGLLDIMLVFDRSGSMDDDTCSWKPYPPVGGKYIDGGGIERACTGLPNQSNCTACYVCSSAGSPCPLSNRQYGEWPPPPQPITAAKAAAQGFVDLNNVNIAKLGLASYADSATTNRQLTTNFASVKTAIAGLNASGCTDAPGGLRAGRTELNSVRGRPEANKMMVFLTDGLPNVAYGATLCGSSCPDHCPAAKTSARNEAITAANERITIYTIALGTKADTALMQDIANITGGEYYYAPSAADLTAIYQTIFEQIRLRIIE